MEEKNQTLLLQAPSEIETIEISYNKFLYDKRKELNLGKRKFAKLLNINLFHYHLLENGYIKPNKKDIKKISKYFDLDFNIYLEGFNHYPDNLNNIKYNRFTNFMYHSFTKKWVRITLLILAITCIITTILGFVLHTRFNQNRLNLQDGKIVEFNDAIIEKGESNFSISNFSFPIITQTYDIGEENNEKAVSIKSKYNSKYLDLAFQEIFWVDDYRFAIDFAGSIQDTYTWDVYSYNYDTSETYAFLFIDQDGERSFLGEGPAVDALKPILEDHDIYNDFDNLIKEKLGLGITFKEVQSLIYEAAQKHKTAGNITRNVAVITLFLSFVFVFLYGFSAIYKKEKNEIHSFNHSDALLGIECFGTNIKKDIRIFPFIPETLLRLTAFFFVFIGALRIVFLTMNVGDYSAENLVSAKELLSIQMMGMFLIFYINFDIFMKDNRIFRNLLLYPLLFLFLYMIEAYLLSAITAEQSIISMVLDRFSFPNPFGTATCYFLMIVFLFLTPNYINTKKKLIIYRSLVIIPIVIIITSFILSNIDVLYGVKFPNYWVKLLFVGDRFPLSILAITYLVSLFFIRLYYKKKYGEKNAERYFNGNRFIFTKNLLAASLIIIIWGFEMMFKGNATLNKMGIGINTPLIILAPLVLLYHPHKNARNAPADILLITIYGLVLAFLYIVGVLVAFVGLFA